jgi:hypothetical protein
MRSSFARLMRFLRIDFGCGTSSVGDNLYQCAPFLVQLNLSIPSVDGAWPDSSPEATANLFKMKGIFP